MEINISTDTVIDSRKLLGKEITFVENENENVFHYTSLAGFEGILRSGTLRFTNIRQMNDTTEFIAGLTSIAKEFKMDEELKKQLFSCFESSERQFFVCCFSLDDDSLPMWHYYTKDTNKQGLNIGFNIKKLLESILQKNPCLDGCELTYGIVDYSRNDDSAYGKEFADGLFSLGNVLIRQLCLSLLERRQGDLNAEIGAFLTELKKKIKNAENVSYKSQTYVFNSAQCAFAPGFLAESFPCFIKNYGFHEERELRIVISVPAQQLEKWKQEKAYNFCVADGMLKSYLKVAFSNEAIECVTTSPTLRSDAADGSIRDFAEFCGAKIEDCSKFVKKSKIPLRY